MHHPPNPSTGLSHHSLYILETSKAAMNGFSPLSLIAPALPGAPDRLAYDTALILTARPVSTAQRQWRPPPDCAKIANKPS